MLKVIRVLIGYALMGLAVVLWVILNVVNPDMTQIRIVMTFPGFVIASVVIFVLGLLCLWGVEDD